MQLKPAILIVSETAFKDPSTDRAGDILRDTLILEGGDKWTHPSVEIVPDDVERIEAAVRRWADDEKNRVNLIITTGGTGFAVNDLTPEAIASLIQRPAPGLVHAMLSESLKVTAFGAMSRPVAGVRGKSLILTLPGSPKGAKENLLAVLKLLPHACIQAAGEDSRAMHVGGVKKLEEEAGIPGREKSTWQHRPRQHVHDQSHGHHIPRAHTKPEDRPPRSSDPSLGTSKRIRSSPYPMLSVPEALSVVLSHCPKPETTTLPISADLVGHVVASDIRALEAVPAYRASIVDGYAVVIPARDSQNSNSIKGTFRVASVSHAQATKLPPALAEETIARVTTGAPLPPNANAVVMVEDTTVVSTTPDGSEEDMVEILTNAIEPDENIREPGSDIKLDSVVLWKGTPITSLGGELGVLVAAGIRSLPVLTKPRVGVLSTGDEVTDASDEKPLAGGQIRDSNRPSLLAILKGWNLCSAVVDLGIARDTPPHALETAIRSSFRDHDLDILISTGGVSMGELDLLKPTIERRLDGTVHFGRVNMKPGKPTTFATISIKEPSPPPPQGEHKQQQRHHRRSQKLIFGLPGNPASAIVTAHLFVLPALQQMAGKTTVPGATLGLEPVVVQLAENIKCDPSRPEYHRAFVSFVRDDPASGGEAEGRGGGGGGSAGGSAAGGYLTARSTGMQRSSRVGSMVKANALLVVRLGGKGSWPEGNGVRL